MLLSKCPFLFLATNRLTLRAFERTTTLPRLTHSVTAGRFPVLSVTCRPLPVRVTAFSRSVVKKIFGLSFVLREIPLLGKVEKHSMAVQWKLPGNSYRLFDDCASVTLNGTSDGQN
ncbi:hypothetical protein AVEN_170655-1 [Araneus ventricosus]|uniref:Uncharacterized protein n=1 Tax=Araneus ventricosus TaxID=182803 RepID=A0A4Y2MCV0_ARAVE|nr:hypothetical protein AVEN_170655-1 [Araneus ventricosus]